MGQGAGPAAPSSSRDAAPSLGSQAPTMARAGTMGSCGPGPPQPLLGRPAEGWPPPPRAPTHMCNSGPLGVSVADAGGSHPPQRLCLHLEPRGSPGSSAHLTAAAPAARPPREPPVALCAPGASRSSRGRVVPSLAAAWACSPVGGCPCLAVVLNAAAVDAPEPAPLWTWLSLLLGTCPGVASQVAGLSPEEPLDGQHHVHTSTVLAAWGRPSPQAWGRSHTGFTCISPETDGVVDVCLR